MKKTLFAIVTTILISSIAYAESITYTDTVRVISSEPVYRTVVTRKPYQECWEEEVPIDYGYDRTRNPNNTVGALIGGAAGGILGHQIGKGHGKDAATIGGAIIGSLIGQNLASKNGYEETGRPRYKTQRKCVTKYTESTERRITQYKNVARYKGYTIIKYSNRPLRRIPITVTISY